MKKWYVVNTRPKKEFQVERLLKEGGFEVYNPKYKQEGFVRPFFTGYEFVLFEYPQHFRLVKYTRGVKSLVGNEEGPIPIHEEMIDEIKNREIDGFIELEKYGSEPDVGDEIQVMEGALKGLKGVFKKELSGTDRAMILLNYVSYQGKLIIEKKKLKKIL
ncbi:MAG: transcription termination/antitermination NusG family protein [Candidatus Aminicenantes bacterium]